MNNMTERNARGKNVLEFGKASMYVIAEDGLQKESIICHSKPAINSEALSGKKVISSRTRAIDFSWKEVHVANAVKHGNEVRVLDLNGSVRVDVNMKRNVNSETRIQCYGGAKSHKKYLNQPSVCLNAPGVNDFSKTANEQEKVSGSASMICSFALDGLKKETSIKTDEVDEKKSRRENDETRRNVFDSQKCFFGKKRLSYGCCTNSRTNSLPREKASSNSTTSIICEKKDDFENSNPIPSSVTEKNVQSSGKFYLKRIFYSNGNNYSKPSNQGYLPQIRKKTENRLGMDSSRTTASSSFTETNPRKSEKILLPLNVSILKNNEKQKHHHLKSIVKLPTVVDKKTGQVHLALEAIAYEQSDYNKWSRRQKRITPGNAKTASSLSFPLISKSIR